jgi:transporter family-2 protein
MKLLSLCIAALVGALLPLQALVNARLGQSTHGALFASLASFCVGSLALLCCWLLLRPAAIDVGTLARVPWWGWSGGLIGALFVVAATVLVPRLGAAALICVVVFGQMLGSLLLDHFGVLHPRQPADALKIVGMALVAAGMLLVVRPWQGS